MGRSREEKVERFGTLKQFREPPVVSRYKPAKFTLGMRASYICDGEPREFVRPVSMRATYGNELNFFSDAELDSVKGFVKSNPVGFKTISNYYLRGNLQSNSTPVESFISFKYSETVYPREKNTYIYRSRGRNLFANNFWKDSELERRALGLRKPNVHGITPDDADRVNGGAIVGPGSKQSSWNLDGLLMSTAQTCSSNFIGHILTGSETGQLQNLNHTIHFSANPQLALQNLTASCIYARPHMIETTASLRSLTGPDVVESGSANLSRNAFPMGKIKIFSGITHWEAGEQAGVVNDEGVFVNRPTTPFYNSYEDYADDLRSIAKDYSIVPEFRISEHIDFYMKKKGGNFLAENPKMLSIFGTPTASSPQLTGQPRIPQNSSEDEFYKVFSTSDFMKHFAAVKKDHKDLARPTEITLTCKAAMKFLPYNGFYPAERTVDIASQFSASYAGQCVFSSSNDSITSDRGPSTAPYARIRPFMTPLFAPGVLFNTIKSGIAVDYPVYTGSFKRTRPKDSGASGELTNYWMIATASSPTNDGGGKLAGWDYRVPFESLVEPERYLAGLSLVDMEVHPSAALDVTASWSGDGDPLYRMMSNNFLAAVPDFFLPSGEFSTLKSRPQKQFLPFRTGSLYGMRIKLRKSYNIGRQQDTFASDGYMFPNDQVADTLLTHPLRETFTMYSRPSAFGPPVSGRGPDIRTQGGTNYNRAHIADSLFGFNPAFTPPYYDGEAWCDIIYRPSSSFVTLGDVLADSSKLFWRFDHLGLGTVSNNTHPYGNLNINRFSMQLSSSFNLFGKIQEPTVDFDANGNVTNVGPSGDDNSVWIIQPKFETPMYNFGDTGVHPITNANGTLTVPTNNSESISKGMWHQFGVMPTDPSRGIFLELEDIPQSFIKNRVKRFLSGAYAGHTIDPFQGEFDYTNIKGAYGHGTTEIIPILDVVEFENKSIKLGQTAQKKVASEAVVAIPFIENKGKRTFFKVDKELVKKAVLNPDVEGVGESIKQMVQSLQKFVVPPTMDCITYPDKVDPIAMYFFEFEFEFDQNDLSHMWQNLMPPSGKIVKMAQTTVSHKLLLNELYGKYSKASGDTLPDKLKWLVFKVKQRAPTNYFSKVAVADHDADPRYKFRFKAGRTGDEVDKELSYSYNWPYDFFSMVELIKLESEIKISPTEQDIDSALVINTEEDLLNSGVQKVEQGKPATSLLPIKGRNR